MIRLISSRRSRSDILLQALVKASHELVWATDSAIWHRRSHDADTFNAARDACFARVERVLLQATKESIIDAAGARRLIGAVMDILTVARWGTDLVRYRQVPDRTQQIAELHSKLRKTWASARLSVRVGRVLRLVS
jgi:hypothetical protein